MRRRCRGYEDGVQGVTVKEHIGPQSGRVFGKYDYGDKGGVPERIIADCCHGLTLVKVRDADNVDW